MIQTPKDLRGPFSLTPRGINAAVDDLSRGVYALGQVKDGQEEFQVRYVGRDDRDLKSGLRRHVAEWYPHFCYQTYFSAQEAFQKECDLYHDFNPPENKAHPVRDENTNWTCPRCGFFD